MKEASALAGGTIINSLFCNQGENITGAIFLVESSYTIHTWVTGYVGLDFYTVKDLDNTKALEFLIRKFGALKYSASEIKRGAEVEKEKP